MSLNINDIYLPVTIADVTFRNPFYIASGPTAKSVWQLERAEQYGWGAASIKLTVDPAPYISRMPRYHWDKHNDILMFTAEKRMEFEDGLRLMEAGRKATKEIVLLANITYAGDKGAAGWVNMATKFEAAGAHVIEFNMCCPNMSYNLEVSGAALEGGPKTGASMGQHADVVSGIIKAVKAAIKIPLFVKLTPEGGRIGQVAKAALDAGADAVGGTANRLGIPPIDIRNPKKPVYYLQKEQSMSCQCGHWLRPLALRDVFEMRKLIGPAGKIMSAGGVRDYKDAVEMAMCGCDLVGISAETVITGFHFMPGLVRDLKKYMNEMGFKKFSDMRDILVPEIKSAAEITLYQGNAELKQKNLAAPCKTACPNSVPAQAYVRLVAEGRFKEAYAQIVSRNPLQSICGYICNHACESECTRGEKDEPVAIREIKRFVLERARKEGWSVSAGNQKKKKMNVAVIGAGPAGLACAHDLNQAGYRVTVFEAENEAGGMLRWAIPEFRLPRTALKQEIAALERSGITLVLGKRLGEDFSVAGLWKDGFDAVFVGIGAQRGIPLKVAGERSLGCFTALDFLKRYQRGEKVKVGKKVAVIGGGFTAVDTARLCVRLGAKEVFMLYRRTKDEMPAVPEEVWEAEEEGVKIMYLVSPKKIIVKKGKVSGIQMVNMVLGEKDHSGRRRPESVGSTEFALPVDMVISALGQVLDTAGIEKNITLDKKGNIRTALATGATAVQGVFAGGDAANGADSVIRAIADGKKAAVSIDRFLAGEKATLQYTPDLVVVDKEQVLERNSQLSRQKRVQPALRNAKQRKGDFKTYVKTYTEAQAMQEAQRCLACGCGEGCLICENLCTAAAITHDLQGMVVDGKECYGCGMCVQRCPNGNIGMKETKNVI
jgi:NADPH-dependent glutamate synthase beta subunit-like oxidoreductase/dihydroorotate dehydrogenase